MERKDHIEKLSHVEYIPKRKWESFQLLHKKGEPVVKLTWFGAEDGLTSLIEIYIADDHRKVHHMYIPIKYCPVCGGTFPIPNPKYTLKDVDILIDAFANLAEKGIAGITAEDLIPLTNYPEAVVQEFLNSIGCIPTSNDYDIHANLDAIRTYIGVRLNLV